MTIGIYRRNDDITFEDAARDDIEKEHPGSRIRVSNPDYFDPKDLEDIDLVYVRDQYGDIIKAYSTVGVRVVPGVDPAISNIDNTVEIAPVDVYEDDVLRLLSLSVNALKDALSRVNDLGVIYLARDRETLGRNRRGAIAVYNDAIISLGGTV